MKMLPLNVACLFVHEYFLLLSTSRHRNRYEMCTFDLCAFDFENRITRLALCVNGIWESGKTTFKNIMTKIFIFAYFQKSRAGIALNWKSGTLIRCSVMFGRRALMFGRRTQNLRGCNQPQKQGNTRNKTLLK